MKMGLFLLSEFIEIVVISALVTTLFLGGYSRAVAHGRRASCSRAAAPWAAAASGVVVLQVLTFSVKVFLVGCFQIQVRWTLPRFRYDQLMDLGWKFLLPLGRAQPRGHRRRALVDPVTSRKPRKQYWNEPTIGLWERLYILEIVRGLSITGGVFFGNMWKWVTGRKGALTAYYPEESPRRLFAEQPRPPRADAAARTASVQCVACNMCATVCPAYCIEIVAVADLADRAHPKSPQRFEIDYSRCIFCGFCVEACPEDAIRMVKDVPDLPGFDRDDDVGTKDLLLRWHPLPDPRKPLSAGARTRRRPEAPHDRRLHRALRRAGAGVRRGWC